MMHGNSKNKIEINTHKMWGVQKKKLTIGLQECLVYLTFVKTNKVDETQEEREMVLLKSVTSEKVKLRKIKLEEVYIIFKIDTFIG